MTRLRRILAGLGLALVVVVFGDAASYASTPEPSPSVVVRQLDPAQYEPILFLLGLLVVLSLATWITAASRPRTAHR